MISKTAIRLAAAAAIGLALGGCGGSTSEVQRVREVVNHFTVDIGQSNPAACDLMTPRFRSKVGTLTVLTQNSLSAHSNCKAAVRTEQQFSYYTSLTISKVVISGAKATVAFAGSSQPVILVNQNGTWLVESA